MAVPTCLTMERYFTVTPSFFKVFLTEEYITFFDPMQQKKPTVFCRLFSLLFPFSHKSQHRRGNHGHAEDAVDDDVLLRGVVPRDRGEGEKME